MPTLRVWHDVCHGELPDHLHRAAGVHLQYGGNVRGACHHAVRAVRLQRGRMQDDLREQRRLPGTDLRLRGHDVYVGHNADREAERRSC